MKPLSLFLPYILATAVTLMLSGSPHVAAQEIGYEDDPFRQLDEILPTPGETRLASGAPGPKYWQQKVDYDIQVTLDDARQRLVGDETITYHNRSPHELSYLWVQLDQNRFRTDSAELLSSEAPNFSNYSYDQLKALLFRKEFKGGYDIKWVKDANDQPIARTVVGTMMRLDLTKPLKPSKKTMIKIGWEHNIVDAKTLRARGGYEFFEEDKNYIYEIAQWYPRMASYTDYAGWQNKQFLGAGEFTIEFGDFQVAITAPADHIVAATGELQNSDEVLSQTQRDRLAAATKSGKIEFIVTPDEAKATETNDDKPTGTKTWKFAAKNVRDFAWASSRKFIWDAKYHQNGGKHIWAMSYYPNEGEPLWSKFSTQAVAHTLDVYTRYTFDYPYPVAISVNGPVGGMEYPMICFNGPRSEDDGTYSKLTRNALISVIIHEVGHNYFPMIVNSDERQWTWMDEGLNTFLQYLSEREWEEQYDLSWGAKPRQITTYMASQNQRPIMTNSESIHQFGNNAYSKPATALNVLRETVLGRELFDFAFKQYANRWKFKRPEPADLFRTMEDASAVDLDWFWRGWFYTTKHVDIGIRSLRVFSIDTHNPDIEKAIEKEKRDDILARDITEERNQAIEKLVDRYPQLRDFYNEFDALDVTAKDRREYQEFLETLEDDEKELLALREKFYVVDLENVGGLVMPVILKVTFDNGESETIRMPAEIWRRNDRRVSRLILTKHTIRGLEIDPRLESADTDRNNNFWPPKPVESRFKLFKMKEQPNPMQELRDEQKSKEDQDGKEAEKKPDAKKS